MTQVKTGHSETFLSGYKKHYLECHNLGKQMFTCRFERAHCLLTLKSPQGEEEEGGLVRGRSPINNVIQA